MAYNNHIDPVEGVSAASKQQELITLQKSAQAEENAWKKALEMKNPARTFSCFWLVIQMINHVGLDVSDGAIIAQSQLMDVEHKMQQCMIKISKAISDIQGQEAGYKVYKDGANVLAPDTFLGLNNQDANNMWLNSASGANSPSNITQSESMTFANATNSLMSSIKQLYYSDGSDTSAPSVADLSKIVNPYVWQNGKDFDLKGLWSDVEGKFNTAGLNNPYGTAFKMISSDPSSKASLLQQYMYYKAQSTVYTSSSDTVNGAQGDISKLVCFDPPSQDPSASSNSDAMITQVLQALTIFENPCTVATTASSDSTTFSLQPTNEPLLKLILLGLMKIYKADDGNNYAGVYAELNMDAYQSYWSKPNAAKGAQTLVPTQLGTPTSGSWTLVDDGVGTSATDVLGGWYAQTNSVQTTLGSDTSTNSSTMQAMTANEGSEVTVGQNAIKALNQYVNALCQNQNSA